MSQVEYRRMSILGKARRIQAGMLARGNGYLKNVPAPMPACDKSDQSDQSPPKPEFRDPDFLPRSSPPDCDKSDISDQSPPAYLLVNDAAGLQAVVAGLDKT